MPAAEGSTVSAFVQQFLHDVTTTVDPWGTVAEGIQQVGLAAGRQLDGSGCGGTGASRAGLGKQGPALLPGLL